MTCPPTWEFAGSRTVLNCSRQSNGSERPLGGQGRECGWSAIRPSSSNAASTSSASRILWICVSKPWRLRRPRSGRRPRRTRVQVKELNDTFLKAVLWRRVTGDRRKTISPWLRLFPNFLWRQVNDLSHVTKSEKLSLNGGSC